METTGNQNLALWESVEKTDPKHTRKTKIGQMDITAIAPQQQRKAATAKFGPYGIGWGLREERFLYLDFDNGTKLATFSAYFWYIWNGEEGSFPVTSNVKVCYITKQGSGYLAIDDEYAKKAQTDALTKGLSFLGFNADVFMGLYDDNKYVNRMKEEFAPPPPPEQMDDATRAAAIALIQAAPDEEGLRSAWTSLTLVSRKDEAIIAAKDAAKALLSQVTTAS